MTKITLKDANYVIKKLKINPKVVSLKKLQKGMQVEMEHGFIDKKTNVTNNDLIKTAKIALAHIIEFPDYYKNLEKMEKKSEKKWKDKKKKNIFL